VAEPSSYNFKKQKVDTETRGAHVQKWINARSETIEKVDPDLTLHGLRIIHELNHPDSPEKPDAKAPKRPKPPPRRGPRSRAKPKKHRE